MSHTRLGKEQQFFVCKNNYWQFVLVGIAMDQSTTRRKSIKGLPLRSRPQCLRMHHFPGLSTCVFFIFPCLSTCVCISMSQYMRMCSISMPQCMRMNFHVSAHAYEFPCLSTCVCFFHASVHAYAISRSQYLRTLILVFVCCKTRLATFVLRGCDSIRIVPVRI